MNALLLGLALTIADPSPSTPGKPAAEKSAKPPKKDKKKGKGKESDADNKPPMV